MSRLEPARFMTIPDVAEELNTSEYDSLIGAH